MNIKAERDAHKGNADENYRRLMEVTKALEMAEGRFRDLGKIIQENGKYNNAGFMFASADRCRAAIDIATA